MVLFFPVFAFIVGCKPTSHSLKQIAGVEISDLKDAHLTEVVSYRVADHQVQEYETKSKDTQARIKVMRNVAPNPAFRLRQQKVFAVESLYRERRNPYAGKISRSIKKPGSPQPDIRFQDSLDMQLTRILAPVGERKTWAIGSRAEVHFQHLWMLIYCKRTRVVVQIEAYMPSTELNPAGLVQWLTPVHCF